MHNGFLSLRISVDKHILSLQSLYCFSWLSTLHLNNKTSLSEWQTTYFVLQRNRLRNYVDALLLFHSCRIMQFPTFILLQNTWGKIMSVLCAKNAEDMSINSRNFMCFKMIFAFLAS